MMKGGKGEQLQMLMPARELKDRIGLSYDVDHFDERDSPTAEHSLNRMWDRKLTESKVPVDSGGRGAGVYDSLAKKGYQGEPLEVRHGDFPGSEDTEKGLRLLDGHHRLSSAADLNLEVPVSHSDANSDNVAYQGRKRMAAAKGVHTWEL
jgi:hypothetical protein